MKHQKTDKTVKLKQPIAWLLLTVFIYNQFFSFVWNEIKISQIRHHVKFEILHQLADNQLVSFQKDLDFDEDEFESEGKMYDVVKAEIKENHQIVYCYLDSEETTLSKIIESQINENLTNNPFKKDSQNQVIKLIKTILEEIKIIDFQFEFTQFFIQKAFFNHHSLVPQNYTSSILNPPEL